MMIGVRKKQTGSVQTLFKSTVNTILYCGAISLFAVLCGNGHCADSSAVEKKYRETVAGEQDLLGYWQLRKEFSAERGSLKLRSLKPELSGTAGPFGSECVNLSDGNNIMIDPAPELDGTEMSVELFFRIMKPAGNKRPCLFGFRSEGNTMFTLHYSGDPTSILLYNGSELSSYEIDQPLSDKEWYHLVMTFNEKSASIWLNGRKCKLSKGSGSFRMLKNSSFILGSVTPAGDFDHADIAVAHLAIYKKQLAADQIKAHVLAAGMDLKVDKPIDWRKSPVSILEAQIGYHPRNIKRVYLRSLQENPPAGYFESDFKVFEVGTDKEVFCADVKKWGRKWESYWWVLDFTALRGEGEYYVKTGKLISSKFKIADNVLSEADLDVIALDQLEHRIHQGLADKRRGMAGKYVNCGPDVRIYMDCGSPYSELEPVGTCVYALMDLYTLMGDRFSEKDRKRMLDLAKMGADYFVAAQRHTDDPETDGMFHHSLLVNTRDTWAGDIFTYLDTAYGMAITAKAHQFFKELDPERAARYLKTSRKAWKLCTHRPYHTKADRTFPKGCNAYFWNAPHGIQDTFGRCLYNILDEKWKMPDTLRTRDRLPFVQGSALLYEITGEKQYLEKAVEFADVIMERQFTDWENPVDGCFGNFYEFQGNDNAFFHEFMQGGFWWEGNVESCNLEGFMHLLRLAPDHPKSASWLNTINTYARNYARKSTTRNPLRLYPVACYRDPQHGGLKNFQNTLMGSSCVQGFSTKNFMVLGAFLGDPDFQLNAIAGVSFLAGLNPGLPNAYKGTAWDARSLIMGVGNSWFGPSGEPAESAKGSIPNGFCASPQFWLPDFVNFISEQPDRPAGLINASGGMQFNETWILHSHSYVHGVARLEARHKLKITTLDAGKKVQAKAVIELRESAEPGIVHRKECQTGNDGTITIVDLPTPAEGFVTVIYNGTEIKKPVAAVAGADHELVIDFSRDVDVGIQVPEQVRVGSRHEAVVTVINNGTKKVTLDAAITSSGVTMDSERLKLTLKPGEKKKTTVTFLCGNKVMPYMVRARFSQGVPGRESFASGMIGSAGQ